MLENIPPHKPVSSSPFKNYRRKLYYICNSLIKIIAGIC